MAGHAVVAAAAVDAVADTGAALMFAVAGVDHADAGAGVVDIGYGRGLDLKWDFVVVVVAAADVAADVAADRVVAVVGIVEGVVEGEVAS